jgi:hypothetical protein
MTIAACYLSSEGVVLGADSTSTIFVAGRGPNPSGAEHQFDFAQKIFQVGESGSIGIAMWGLGSLPMTSFRTLVAELADELDRTIHGSMLSIANRWADLFWQRYLSEYSQIANRAQALAAQALRSNDEEAEYAWLMQSFSGGFCIGGCCLPDRNPSAYEIVYSPQLSNLPPPAPLQPGSTKFWGCPNLMERLLYGIDPYLFDALMKSGKWSGTDQELFDVVQPHMLGQPTQLPLREAIDWVHASIYSTIKTMKFSHMAPVCGGPIEIAVISSDRHFRWVRHKSLDAAICADGGPDA